ncbi:MAG: MBL fold metallo-hydrolase [Anaerolineae bacterium]|jgi:L-ascorbate metabolism protein UlaG (beta-lactamase superfamily)
MDIEWRGDSSFVLRTQGCTVLVDPGVGGASADIPADIVILSRRDEADPGCASASSPSGAFVIDGPGEYEIGGVFVIGKRIGGSRGGKGASGQVTGYVVDADDVTVCHLGGLSEVPAPEHLEALGPVDVLLVPVGGGPTLGASEAVEVVGQVEPSIIVPARYAVSDGGEMETVDRFLSEIGAESPEQLDVLEASATKLPLEPKVVLLRPRS